MNLSAASGVSCSNFEVHKCKVDNLVTVMILKLIQKATNKIATMDFMKNPSLSDLVKRDQGKMKVKKKKISMKKRYLMYSV